MSALEIVSQVKDYNKKLIAMDSAHLASYGFTSRGIREEMAFARDELRLWLHRANNT